MSMSELALSSFCLVGYCCLKLRLRNTYIGIVDNWWAGPVRLLQVRDCTNTRYLPKPINTWRCYLAYDAANMALL